MIKKRTIKNKLCMGAIIASLFVIVYFLLNPKQDTQKNTIQTIASQSAQNTLTETPNLVDSAIEDQNNISQERNTSTISKPTTTYNVTSQVAVTPKATLKVTIKPTLKPDPSITQKETLKPTPTPEIKPTQQVITTTFDGGNYKPITVKKGIPVKWIIKIGSNDLNGCNNTLIIPKFGIEKELIIGDNIIQFTPDKVENIQYSCWMGMIRSYIKVV